MWLKNSKGKFAGSTLECGTYKIMKSKRFSFSKWTMKWFMRLNFGLFIVGAVLGIFILGTMNSKVTYAQVEVPVMIKDSSNSPILERIINCESGGNQFDKNGYVLRGKVNPEDWGLAQINVSIWGAKSKELGYDITTEAGNRAMAQWLLDNKGSGVWSSSAKCWNR